MSSSLLSELGFSPLSNFSTEAFDDETEFRQGDTEQVVAESVEETVVIVESPPETIIMPDPALTAELKRLEKIKKEVDLSLRTDLIVSRAEGANSRTIVLMKQQLADTHSKARAYSLGMSDLGSDFPSLEESMKLQYDADGVSLVMKVNQHTELVHAAMPAEQPQHQQQVNPSHQMQDTGQLQMSSQSDSAVATCAKAVVKYNQLLEDALTVKQDVEEDGVYLEDASDEKISRLVHKIVKYEEARKRIKTGYNNYQEFTAVHKPDNAMYDASKLATAVSNVLSEIDNLIKGLEEQDEERGLATLLTRKTEKMKWPTFSGKAGENFSKFKKQFLKVASRTWSQIPWRAWRQPLPDLVILMVILRN